MQYKLNIRLILIFLLITDLIIVLDIPILRQIVAFLFFTLVPGFLVVRILKIDLNFTKIFVLSVGLSEIILMITGLIVNFSYPLIFKPLSLYPLLISFNLVVISLIIGSYFINGRIAYTFQFISIEKDKILALAIFPVLILLLMILGVYLMNISGNNFILLITSIIIPIYISIVFFLYKRTPKIAIPIALISIAASILLMHTLISSYLVGRDVYLEYYIYLMNANNFHWNVLIPVYGHDYNACLSVTVLPIIYKTLMGIDGLYVFKIILPLIIALIPLVCFTFFKKYLPEKYAFLAAFLLMIQIPFIQDLTSATRSGIALFFFALAVMVFFDENIKLIIKRILILLLILAVVVSHYTTAYIFLAILSVIWVLNTVQRRNRNFITGISILFFFCLIFFWYAQLTVGFQDIITFLNNTLINSGNFWASDMREQSSTAVLGIGVNGISRWLALVLQDVITLFLTLGLFGVLIKKLKKIKFEREYLIIALTSWVIISAMLVVPYISTAYGVYRVYETGLITLAPMFIMGIFILFKRLHLKKIISVFIILIIALQFLSVTFVLDQLLGNPVSESLNKIGDRYDEYYVYDAEIAGSRWLAKYGNITLRVNTDNVGGFGRILIGYGEYGKYGPINRDFFTDNITQRGYIYLRNANLNGKIYTTGSYADIKNITSYSNLLDKKNLIYDSGKSEVNL